MSVKESVEPITAAQAQAAFCKGIAPDSAEYLLRTPDEGLASDRATQAVADGLAQHHGASHEPLLVKYIQPTMAAPLLGSLVAYLILRPVVGLGHELTVAMLAWMFHAAVDSNLWEPVISFLGLDPIYTGAAIRAAGGVQVAGIAIGGPVGPALHSVLPGVFLEPQRLAPGAGISMVAAPGAPALGRGLAAFGADVLWLAIGLWLFWRWRRTNWRMAMLGLLIQAQVGVNHLLEAHVGLAELDASGVPFALELAMPNGGWFTSGLGTVPSTMRDLLVGGGLVVLAYVCALLLLVIGVQLVRFLPIRRRSNTVATARPWARRQWSTPLASVGLALVTAWSPVGALALGNSNWQVSPGLTDLGLRSTPLAAGRLPGDHNHTLPLAGATPVSIVHRSDGSWQYVVDGTTETIRGVGYNPWYAGLDPTVRASLYQRDFSAMHRLGINTIDGWFENQFDSVTLDSAARNGIGILMPFELNQDWDYTDPVVLAGILDRITAYVERYKNHPAVRMWAPGNENLHRILFAHWISQLNDPKARVRATAFATFLPTLVDRIHVLDPNHPVVYRDADDAYLSWITNGFGQTAADRPWLVYGANVYTAAQMQEVISNWPNQWPGRPLLISEFAPGGLGPAQRPLGFQQLWGLIRSRPGVVLGGLAYTWATNGPEDLDRVFGLVDPNGVPTDGALAALSTDYLAAGDGVVADATAGN